MRLTSEFEDNGKIPSKYTCDGENAITPLQISDVPENAKSLALVMDDPDAMKPAGKVWDHWIMWNIPSDTKEISSELAVPHGTNSFNRKEWGGPCPPDAEHTYIYKLYALDIMLDIPDGSTKAELEKAMEGHIVEKAELKGRYERKQ